MFGILGGVYVDYKKEIIEIIEKIESEKILRYIYLFLVDICLEKEKK